MCGLPAILVIVLCYATVTAAIVTTFPWMVPTLIGLSSAAYFPFSRFTYFPHKVYCPHGPLTLPRHICSPPYTFHHIPPSSANYSTIAIWEGQGGGGGGGTHR